MSVAWFPHSRASCRNHGNADFLRVADADPALAGAISGHGLATILSRHTRWHRMDEFLAIVDSIAAATALETAP